MDKDTNVHFSSSGCISFEKSNVSDSCLSFLRQKLCPVIKKTAGSFLRILGNMLCFTFTVSLIAAVAIVLLPFVFLAGCYLICLSKDDIGRKIGDTSYYITENMVKLFFKSMTVFDARYDVDFSSS